MSWRNRYISRASGATSDADGWQFDMHDGLTGVAHFPEHDTPWARTAVEKLSSLHGVIFLNDDEARDYMKGDGAHWAAFHARSRKPDVNEPSATTKCGKIRVAVRKAIDTFVRRIG
jgi:hypothetical protein